MFRDFGSRYGKPSELEWLVVSATRTGLNLERSLPPELTPRRIVPKATNVTPMGLRSTSDRGIDWRVVNAELDDDRVAVEHPTVLVISGHCALRVN